jgi:TonB family protein
MFDFAISQNRQHKPTRRWLACSVASFAAHVAALLILVINPELLRPGKGHWLSHLLHLAPATRLRIDPNWRTVTFVGGSGKLQSPSIETLRKYAYDWNRGSGTGDAPAVRIQLDKSVGRGDSERAEKRNPALGTQDPKPLAGSPQGTPAGGTETAKAAVEPAGAPVQVAAAGGAETRAASERGTVVYLPAPELTAPRQIPKKVETAANTSPAAIPSGVAPPEPAPAKTASSPPPQIKGEPKVFTDQQSAIRTEGSGFFDTKGFPLGEYARQVIDRVKGNWSIPSNLRHSQGRSTLIFYIEKDGRVSGLRVITASGSDSLDLAALNSVLGANPFPPLPTGFPGGHVGAKFVFSYNEHP